MKFFVYEYKKKIYNISLLMWKNTICKLEFDSLHVKIIVSDFYNLYIII